MELRYMQTELTGEPGNIVDWIRNPRTTLRHRCATRRTLRGDRIAIYVASQLHVRTTLHIYLV